jgi:hypothetical protein
MNENKDFEPTEFDIENTSLSGILLDELLAQITPENLHGEIDFGNPVGRELL